METYFSKCPRCEIKSLENLETYSHCVNCQYFQDTYEDSESMFYEFLKAEKIADQVEVQAQITGPEENEAA